MERANGVEQVDGTTPRAPVGGVELREAGLLLRTWRPADATAVHRACQDPAIQRWTRVPSPYLPEHAVGFVTEIAARDWADGTGAPEERDVSAIMAACRDPLTIRWTSLPDPYRDSDARSFVTGYAPLRWAAGEGAVFTVADGTDEYAGTVELRLSPTDPAVSDVGVLIAPHARGRGYGAAALATVAAWGCATLGVVRVEWRAQVGNIASRRAAERAGFVVEGTARGGVAHRGRRVDAWFGAFVPTGAGWPASAATAEPLGLAGARETAGTRETDG